MIYQLEKRFIKTNEIYVGPIAKEKKKSSLSYRRIYFAFQIGSNPVTKALNKYNLPPHCMLSHNIICMNKL